MQQSLNTVIRFLSAILRSIMAHLFIAASASAAFIHSAWSLATMFRGIEPTLQFSPEWWAWYLPAAALAFSIDIGQIITSAQIQRGERTTAKYWTFGVLAVATYYLQFLFIAHFMPELTLSAGINSTALPMVGWMRDAAPWVLPAFFPMSMLLYTFSYGKTDPKPPTTTITQTRTTMTIERPAAPALGASAVPQIEAGITAYCDECDYSATKGNLARAKAAVRFHKQARHKKQAVEATVDKETE